MGDVLINEANLIVSEVYSPPRVTKAAKVLTKLGITPGFALDITVDDETGEPWDLSKPEKQDKAVGLTIDTEPDLIVGSPPCIDFIPCPTEGQE